MIKNILTFDIEDWFHILHHAGVAESARWNALPGRVEIGTRRILDVLDAQQTQATFFVLGWIAAKYPDLVREIESRGHEIATHGQHHQPADRLTPEAFRRDVATSLDVLSGIVSRPIEGYRAPGFSIHAGNARMLDVLLDLGLRYDSSIAPSRHAGFLPGRCGWILTPKGRFIFELPATPIRVFGRRMYFFGGAYFRLIPYGIARRGIRRLNARRQPAVVYLHPRELDPGHPRLPLQPHRTLITYGRLGSTQSRLARLVRDFQFDSVRNQWTELRRRARPVWLGEGCAVGAARPGRLMPDFGCSILP